MHRFDRARLPAAPWKNGGGVTREIIARPLGSGLDTFTWRVSIAEVSADGAFSEFAGVDRVIALLAGNGVVLRAPDGRLVHRLDEPFACFTFRGEEPITASLIDGASSDFNVMTRRSATRAEVRVIRVGETLASSGAGVLFAARGRWTLRFACDDSRSRTNVSEAPIALGDGEGVWWEDESPAWHVATDESDAALFVAHVYTL
jgi:environmental stress-induced protein Ves